MSRSNNTTQTRKKREILRSLWGEPRPDLLSRIQKEDNALPVSLNRHGNNRKWKAAEKVRTRRKDRRERNDFDFEM